VQVLIGMPALAMPITVASLRRVQVDPLSVSGAARRSPSAWTALPWRSASPACSPDPLEHMVSDVMLNWLAALFALSSWAASCLIGPWLCLLVGRGPRPGQPDCAGLIAARRIAADPWGTVRAISAVVRAAMVVAYLGSTAGQFETRTEAGGGGARLRPGVVEVNTGGVSASRVAPLLSEQTVVAGFGLRGLAVPCASLSRVVEVSCPYSGPSSQVEPTPDSDRPGIIERLYIPTDGTLAAEAEFAPGANLANGSSTQPGLRDRNEPSRRRRAPGDIGCMFMLSWARSASPA
jgi:hypothetical protein